MTIEIKSRWTGAVLYSAETDNLKTACEMAARNRIVLSGAVLSDADLRGADLRGADLRGAVLSGAVLSDAVLRGADLSGAVLSGAVLSGADLRGAVLRGAVLSDAVLSGADLRGAVLRGAEFYRVNNLHQSILAAIENGGSLEMGSWHTCETTHCRAGWAIHLAGNAGRLLEAQVGSAAAGAFITQASCPWLEKVPNFYADNETAFADIQAMAEREKAECAR